MRADLTQILDLSDSSFNVLTSMSHCLSDPDSEKGDVYFVGRTDEGVAALMIVSGGMSKKIDELVAKRGNGTPMVEFGMNHCKGRASLDSFDTASTRFWSKMGFVRSGDLPAQASQGGCKMRLICSQSVSWVNNEGWKYQKYQRAEFRGLQAREPQPYQIKGGIQKESIW
jgi:hypothetical protein